MPTCADEWKCNFPIDINRDRFPGHSDAVYCHVPRFPFKHLSTIASIGDCEFDVCSRLVHGATYAIPVGCVRKNCNVARWSIRSEQPCAAHCIQQVVQRTSSHGRASVRRRRFCRVSGSEGQPARSGVSLVLDEEAADWNFQWRQTRPRSLRKKSLM